MDLPSTYHRYSPRWDYWRRLIWAEAKRSFQRKLPHDWDLLVLLGHLCCRFRWAKPDSWIFVSLTEMSFWAEAAGSNCLLSESSVSIALICTTRRRIPEMTNVNKGLKEDNLSWAEVREHAAGVSASVWGCDVEYTGDEPFGVHRWWAFWLCAAGYTRFGSLTYLK